MARTTVSAYAVSWQLMVSKKCKYLEEQNGVLFLVLADTAQLTVHPTNTRYFAKG